MRYLLAIVAAIVTAVLCGVWAVLALGWQVGTPAMLTLTMAVSTGVFLALLTVGRKGAR